MDNNKHYSPYAQAQTPGRRSNRITGLGGSITNSACSPDHWGAPEKAPCVPRRQACPPLSPWILHAGGIRWLAALAHASPLPVSFLPIHYSYCYTCS